MANRVPITIRLETFEGPLDLLLYLIQSHELDISRVSIGRITDQYLAYVRLMQELNFDIASEFLVMAATLLHWKSKALLPQEKVEGAALAEEDEFTQEDLIRQLLEHQRFKAAGEDLSQLPRLGEDVFTRPNKRPPIERIWKEMNISDLSLSYQDMLARARKRTTILKKETVSLTDKIQEFSDKLQIGKPTELSKFIGAGASYQEKVVAFLASLELARLRKLRLHQEKTYDEIYLELIASLKGFEISLASGFDNPNPPKAEDVADSAEAPAAEHAEPGNTHLQHGLTTETDRPFGDTPSHAIENAIAQVEQMLHQKSE